MKKHRIYKKPEHMSFRATKEIYKKAYAEKEENRLTWDEYFEWLINDRPLDDKRRSDS